jgi:hypothetical protein
VFGEGLAFERISWEDVPLAPQSCVFLYLGMTRQFIELFNDESLEISFMPGSGGDAVVSFAGVGLHYLGKDGPMQTEEFAKSLETSTVDTYFVKDKLRHWFFESADRIVEILNRHLQSRKTAATTCIGNSMGGFGAIYFAPRLHNCRNSIAFAPQSSINTLIVPWESRWMDWRASLAPGAGLDAAKSLDPGVSYTIFAGVRDRSDLRHVRRLVNKAPKSLTAIGLLNAGHGAARRLKRRGALEPLVLSLLAGRREEAMTALRRIPHDILTSANVVAFVRKAPKFRAQGSRRLVGTGVAPLPMS